jgi:butyrate kinase
MFSILVINPGSTSTKAAVFADERCEWAESIDYPVERLSVFHAILEQLDTRLADLLGLLSAKGVRPGSLAAVSSRGGPFKPLEGGTYRVTRDVIEDVYKGRVQFQHASLMGVCLADRLVRGTQVPAFFVDPVSVDEFEPLARLSGLPELERKSLVHALNLKAVARKMADRMGVAWDALHLVIAHLGGGISIGAIRNGRIVDVNNAVEGGPFSPERAGSLPVSSLVRWCYSGQVSCEKLQRKIVGRGGLAAHLGTNDAIEVERRILAGDAHALRVYEAMAYQIAKEIGAMCTVLNGRVDGIALTGGLAKSSLLTEWIETRVKSLGPVHVFPGEFEMEALAMGALRVLRGEESAKSY